MRICIYAGPGCGKTTCATHLFSQLKQKQFSVAYVPEQVKSWATIGRTIKKFDQVQLFGNQMAAEYENLGYGVKNIVTDSPLLLGSVYARLHAPNTQLADGLDVLRREYERDFQGIHIILKRNKDDHPYVTEGRYQTEQQATDLDAVIERTVLEEYGMPKGVKEPILRASYGEWDKMIKFVDKYID